MGGTDTCRMPHGSGSPSLFVNACPCGGYLHVSPVTSQRSRPVWKYSQRGSHYPVAGGGRPRAGERGADTCALMRARASTGRPPPNLGGMSATTRRVLLAKPRGYCAGVDRAVQTVEMALERF